VKHKLKSYNVTDIMRPADRHVAYLLTSQFSCITLHCVVKDATQ